MYHKKKYQRGSTIPNLETDVYSKVNSNNFTCYYSDGVTVLGSPKYSSAQIVEFISFESLNHILSERPTLNEKVLKLTFFQLSSLPPMELADCIVDVLIVSHRGTT